MKEFVHNGRKLLAVRKFQEAVKVCRLGLLEDPANVEGRLVLAQALMSLARYDEVIAETRAALEIKQDSAPATVLLGEALFFKGAYVQARETLLRAAALDPDNASVRRLLDELDATIEVGIEATLDAVGDATRSYPDAGENASVGDETEIQELPGALQAAPDPTLGAMGAGAAGAARGAVEAAHKAAEDQERPDPIAGEMSVSAAAVGAPQTPEVKVDVSQADAEFSLADGVAGAPANAPAPAAETADPAAPTLGDAPPDAVVPPPEDAALVPFGAPEEGAVHTGEISSSPTDPDGTAALRKTPVTPRRPEGSESGARRWAERKWIGPDEAATREALLVPTPTVTTEEMRDSDLFGRGAPTSEQRPGSAGRGALPRDGSAPASGEMPDATVETKISRPDGSGALSQPEQAPGPPRTEQPTAAAKPRPPGDPWSEDDDEETRPLRTVSQDQLPKGLPHGRAKPSLAQRQPPPPPGPPPAKSPFRVPPLAGRPAPGGLRSPAPRLPGPGAQGLPKPTPVRPAAPGTWPADPELYDTPELSGVHFTAPPAAPPARAAAGPPLLSARPLASPPPGQGPLSATPQPATPAPGPTSHAPYAPPTPVAPRPMAPTPRPAASSVPATAAPGLAITQRVTPPSAREHTAPAARYPTRPSWLTARWRLLAIIGGAVALLATVVILIVVALRKDQQSAAVKRNLKAARTQLERASFASLRRADDRLRKVLQESPGHKVARSLRLFVAAVNAVEFGAPADHLDQMLDQGTYQHNDLAAAAKVLAALAGGDRRRTEEAVRQAEKRWPRSSFVAYARGVVALWQGNPTRSLRILEETTARQGKLLLLRAKIRALLALEQPKDAERLLKSLSEQERQTPWARVLALRHRFALHPDPLALPVLDPGHQLAADATGRVGPRQKRWAHYLLAEGYGRLERDAERQRHLSAVLAGGGFRDPELAEAVARLQLRHKAPLEAQRLIQTVRRRYPGRLTAVLIEASAAMDRAQPKEVLRLLDAMEARRRTPQMNLLRGRAALALGRFPLARRILAQLRKAYPQLSGAHLAWARLLTHDGRLDEALAALDDVLMREPRNVEVIRDAARLELRRGKAADAVIRLEVAVRLRARDPELRAELVRAYLAAGSYKFAQTSIEAATAAFPDTPSILSGKGQLQSILGRYEEALQAYDTALKKAPTLTDALVGRAEALLASGRLPEAEEAVKRAAKAALEMRPLLRGWLALERWDMAKGDHHQALTQLTAASRQKGTIGLRGGVLRLQYHAKAMSRKAGERAFEELSRRFGARPELRSALALVRLDDDSYNAARTLLNAALSDPASSRISPVERAEIHARLAHSYWLAGSFGAASTHARKALARWARCPRALAILGIVAYELGSSGKAKERLLEAVAANPNLALAHHYLGKAYQRLGNRRAARRHLYRYLKLRPKGPLSSDSRKALRR